VNRIDDATALLARAALTDPQFFPALAETYERQQRWKEAASAYEQALKSYPGNAELKTRLAVALLTIPGGQDAGKARDLLAQALKDNPNNARVVYLMAQAQRAAKDYDGAEQTARRLMVLTPTSAAGPEVLARIYADRGEPEKVIALLQPLMLPDKPGANGIPPDELVSLQITLGFAYQERGELDRAIATFEQARKQSPSNVTLALYLAQAHLEAGHTQATLDLIQELRAAGSDDLRLARLEAEALRRTGKIEQGAEVLKAAIATHPGDPTGYLLLAELYIGAQKYDEALGLLHEAGLKFPDDLSILFQEGAALERSKRYDEAEATFRRVVAKDPQHALALNYLGYMMADRGRNLDEAIGYIKRALAIEPGNPSYLDSLGWAYYKQNKLDLAETNLRAAAESRVRDSAIQDHYGDVLERRGQYADAVAAWDRALAGDGEQVDRAAIERKIKAVKGKSKLR
jgi:tetratricopeptide (TPR) repeat protein